MLGIRIALFAAICAYGAYNHNHIETVCGDTRNRAACELSLNAGKTDIAAHNAGNGIYN